MAMESEAEALGQLATDDLEGKVKLDATKFNSVVVATSAYDYLFVHSLHCWRLHLSMMILHKWKGNYLEVHWYVLLLDAQTIVSNKISS